MPRLDRNHRKVTIQEFVVKSSAASTACTAFIEKPIKTFKIGDFLFDLAFIIIGPPKSTTLFSKARLGSKYVVLEIHP